MQINSVTSIPLYPKINSSFTLPKSKKSVSNTCDTVRISRTQNIPNVSFRGAPWEITVLKTSSKPISAQEAIKYFGLLKCGNYLDIGDDSVSAQKFERNNAIRQVNLSFLDRVTDPEEKRKFIEYYRNLTGFPDLGKVSDRIKEEFVSAVSKAEKELGQRKYKVVQAGYDGVCSVGRRKAFPGSDLDKAYVIISGSPYFENTNETLNQFKGSLWFNTDQRILSYNHDEASFPQVYTLRQLEKMVHSLDKSLYKSRFPLGISGKDVKPVFQEAGQQQNLLLKSPRYMPDYVEANPFYIALTQQHPSKKSRFFFKRPTKEEIKNLGFLLEAIREGETLGDFPQISSKKILSSDVYRLSNLSQLRALKARTDQKPKRLARNNMAAEFNSWPLDKQYRFIKTLIHASCANNRDFTNEFSQYFNKPGNDPFRPLISKLMGEDNA